VRTGAWLAGLGFIGCSSVKNTAPENTRSDDTAPNDTAPNDTAPRDTASTDSGLTDDSGTPPSPAGCTTWGPPVTEATVSDASLVEISGIAVSRANPGLIWVHQDSGSGPMLTAINTSGDTLGTLTLTGASSTDWEDLALGPCGDATCLWVGDIGDNAASRTDVALWATEEPVLAGLTDFALTASGTRYPFSYPEGPQDAEALVIDQDGTPFVLTKRTDMSSRVYRIPTAGPAEAELIGTLSTGTIAGLPTATTAADLWAETGQLIVRGYLYTFEVRLGEGGMRAAPSTAGTQVVTGIELQGEAIAYDPAGPTIWHVSEGSNPQLWRIPCAD
jgi:hypothetical protein